MSISKLDANQCIRSSYDDATGTLAVSIGSLTTEIELDADDGDSVKTRSLAVDVTTALDAVSAGANQTSTGISFLEYKNYAVQISWDSLTGTLDGVVVVQASLDDTIYTDLSASQTTLSAASGNTLFNAENAAYKYFRISYTANGVTTGNLTAKYTLKG